MDLKLNIGAGDTKIEGFTPIDRKVGCEAYPLAYADGSVDEIRASHILEHFADRELLDVLREWSRVLRDGGRIRIAVPDMEWIAKNLDNPLSMNYMMGGQTDENDFHRSAFTETKLRRLMGAAGIPANVGRWNSTNTDCASLAVSLNLEGYKERHSVQPKATEGDIKIAAVMSVPRVGWNDHWGCVFAALRPFNIPIRKATGPFWGQCMQRMFQGCVKDGLDWILSIDYDTIFKAESLDKLMGIFGRNPNIDALAALQARRHGDTPLMSIKGQKGVEIEGDTVQVDTAHFGLTLIRVEALKEVEKPWFMPKPNADNEWGDGRMDDDIWFWHQFKKAGKIVCVAPRVNVGHLQLMVSDFDENFQVRHTFVPDWIGNAKSKI